MIFNSLEYLIFLVVTFILYYLVKPKYRHLILLLASYIFYGYSGIKNIFILLSVTIITYYCGNYISKSKNEYKKRTALAFSIISSIGILLYFKYFEFILKTINDVFSTNFMIENIVVPLGISFFILQAITYPIDIYRNDVKREKNILKYALFVSFFPQILSGPIGKSKEMIQQISDKHYFKKKEIKEGLIVIIYGLFQKLVIADCIAIGVNKVYNNLENYTGIPILIVVFLYSLQIYFDFASYSNMARGSAKLFGYKITKNFNNPYFSKSIKEFWSRWHISLSTWFRDYVYFPLGGNRKGILKTCINLLIVFIVSGLWHGAAYTFIVWGLLHGLYQIIERIIKFKIKNNLINNIIVFLLVTFAWIFFRANNINDAFYVINNIFNINFTNIKSQIFSIGLDKYDLFISLVFIVISFVIEFINEKTNIIEKLESLPLIIRWGIYLLSLFIIIIFGHYGPGFDNSQFIYLGY